MCTADGDAQCIVDVTGHAPDPPSTPLGAHSTTATPEAPSRYEATFKCALTALALVVPSAALILSATRHARKRPGKCTGAATGAASRPDRRSGRKKGRKATEMNGHAGGSRCAIELNGHAAGTRSGDDAPMSEPPMEPPDLGALPPKSGKRNGLKKIRKAVEVNGHVNELNGHAEGSREVIKMNDLAGADADILDRYAGSAERVREIKESELATDRVKLVREMQEAIALSLRLLDDACHTCGTPPGSPGCNAEQAALAEMAGSAYAHSSRYAVLLECCS